MDGVRIALVGRDVQVLDECVTRLGAWGALASPRTVLSELSAAAERCAIVVVFADELDDEAIRTHLDGIERWRAGPTLMVVSDRSPPPWSPTLQRDRPALVVGRAEWTARLLSVVAPPTDPELPVTD